MRPKRLELEKTKDLQGWSIQTWFELRLSKDEAGGYTVAGYFTDSNLATAEGRGKGWYGADGRVVPVLVLTQDSTSGWIAEPDSVTLSEQEELKSKAVERARAKLTVEDKKLLGLD